MARGYPEYKKHLHEFFENGILPCPDCGIDLPAGDSGVIQAHLTACPGKRPALTAPESERYQACNAIIANGIRIWYQVGEALLAVRDERLYRAEYPTFEAYLTQKWELKQSRAYQLMDAAQVVRNLESSTIVELPANESQARELTSLEPEAQRLGWQIVEDTAPDGKITAAHVKSVVNVLKEVFATGAIDDGTGEQIPVAAATPEHLKAAITEETYERMQRQEAHIAEHQARKAGGVPPALQSSESNEWYTPKAYIDAVHAVLGAIDVDPASNAEANKLVQAAAFYDVLTDGLVRDWRGKVFLNPPYGRDGISNQERWSLRLIEQYQAGITTEAILLVNAVTDRTWFQALWDFPICFTHHRIPFYKPGGSPGAQPVCGSAFVYLGANHIQFARVFRQFGAVVLTTIRGDDHE
jgi:hypothetical protein